jgi:hypothetical protein
MGGTGTGGTSGASGPVGGSAGTSPTAATEAVIGCEAATWPDAGFYFEAPPATSSSDHSAKLLSTFSPDGISGDGKLVVGHASDVQAVNGTPVTWSMAGGITQPWPMANDLTYAMQASCDGSALLIQTMNYAYRFLAGQDPADALVQVLNGGTPAGVFLPSNPDLTVIYNSFGSESDDGPIPLRWSVDRGFEVLYDLAGWSIYGLGPDGQVIAADQDELFRYDESSLVRTPIGMSPVDLPGGWYSFRSSADGTAWIQSADLHYASFFVGHVGAEAHSVTCPNPCRLRDLSGTGQIALLDVQFEPDVSTSSSWLWSEKTGLVDLTQLFEQHGFDFQGRKLLIAAMSDDGRAFAGKLSNINDPFQYSPFVYAVLPAAAYE